MFLSKRSNGIYYVVYKNQNGKRTLISTKTKKKSEAYAFLTKFNETIKKRESKIKQIKLWDFAINYMRYSEAHHSKLTSRDYEISFKKFRAFVGDIILTQISCDTVESYLTNRIRTGSLHQGRKDQINLKAAFNYAVKNGYLEKNPCEKIKRIHVPEKLPVFFSKDEYETLLNHIDNPDIKDLAIVAANTGMRQGELINLQWKSVNIDKSCIALDNQYF